MTTEIKQKQKWCPTCGRKTLHVATVKTQDMGCGFIFINLLLCLVTFGLWIPIFILIIGMGSFGNSISPWGAKYLCQGCGRRN